MDYHLKPLANECATTGQPLSPGSIVHSVLVEQNGELIRRDYSAEGWHGPPPGTVGQWRCVVPPAEVQHPRPLDPDSLLEQFSTMVESANAVQEPLCYVIALLLMQKRRLILEGTRRDGDVTYLQFIGHHGEGPFEVRDQQLTGDEIDRLQMSLNQQLKAA